MTQLGEYKPEELPCTCGDGYACPVHEPVTWTMQDLYSRMKEMMKKWPSEAMADPKYGDAIMRANKVLTELLACPRRTKDNDDEINAYPQLNKSDEQGTCECGHPLSCVKCDDY